jgi:hypothetical protein
MPTCSVTRNRSLLASLLVSPKMRREHGTKIFLTFDWHPRATPTAHWSVPTLTQRLCHLRSFAWPTALALHSRVHLPPSFGDQPFGECFDTAFLAVIAHAILGGRPPLPSRGEQAPAEDPAAAEERARMMEAIALSVFRSQATAGAAPHWVRCVRTSPRALAACALVRSEFAFVRGVPRGRSCASARFWAGPAAPTQRLTCSVADTRSAGLGLANVAREAKAGRPPATPT